MEVIVDTNTVADIGYDKYLNKTKFGDPQRDGPDYDPAVRTGSLAGTQDVIKVGDNITLDGTGDGYVEIKHPAKFSIVGDTVFGFGRNQAAQPEGSLAPDMELPTSDTAGQQAGKVRFAFGVDSGTGNAMYASIYGNDTDTERQLRIVPENLDDPVIGKSELVLGHPTAGMDWKSIVMASSLAITQLSTTGAVQPLILTQNDVDISFISFQGGTVYTGKEAVDEFLRIRVGENIRYLQLFHTVA